MATNKIKPRKKAGVKTASAQLEIPIGVDPNLFFAAWNKYRTYSVTDLNTLILMFDANIQHNAMDVKFASQRPNWEAGKAVISRFIAYHMDPMQHGGIPELKTMEAAKPDALNTSNAVGEA